MSVAHIADIKDAKGRLEWSTLKDAVQFSAAAKEKNRNPADTLPVSTTSTSVSAAFARSLVLFTGFLFRRPSKLFRPNRVDTWLGLRQLALSTEQTISPAFIRSLLRQKAGIIAVTLTILPPMLVNATLGFLLFTSHSLLTLGLSRLSFFQKKVEMEDGTEIDEEEDINLETLIRGPSIIPSHPTILSAIAGAGAGLVQGFAFTPVENVVRFLHQSATSWTTLLARLVHLPVPEVPNAFEGKQPTTPMQAIKNLFASETWRKNRNWWIGWRWVVARDALSYSCFFAAFDVTRRAALRVKALFGGNIEHDWENIFIIEFPDDHPQNASPSISNSPAKYRPDSDQPQAPTIARVAQATTIVTGGIIASYLAQMAGRPFRACQRIMMLDERERMRAETAQGRARAGGAGGVPSSNIISNLRKGKAHPILEVLRTKGIRPFIHPEGQLQSAPMKEAFQKEGRLVRTMKSFGWKIAAMGPWGFGFLVWAWVGGEV
ncbi:hypothetical protein C343_02566 [Cryptococcus neoformans C23]|uniref:Mitochondrial carrier protein n=1 Tax=Cryptococcus neoformans (strain H99 / ATCC 208821 / CBS 10515 / FGSC 9487) TaxID=235443 RepID=J9VJ66_CRYN9|nr:hypothetical protein CNAG_05227 [Cryptococcus neoformans var. grubii H99]AFR94482.1 hypothetical protein CNAG_05227 [Cryptococcus neoformans var. grubii H99]AUB24143.1 hypothetical protein CKF44_05227 [Cryptococcus neoformans var. grubii]OWZ45133.1 hypothetical protein C343_02566 [Cryptococcus neoformans var. grubii C23]|eukprot:XP_012048789.1 hypothetical protein CNAG_05227 [Cryptococcus neoformans var. grubii H99]